MDLHEVFTSLSDEVSNDDRRHRRTLMGEQSSGLPGDTGKGKIEVPTGIIPPCDKFEDCKIANVATGQGQMILENKGYLYWIGNLMCMRCTHLKKTDLFEDIRSRLIAKHPDATQVEGVSTSDIIKP